MSTPTVYPPTYTMSITETLALPFDSSGLLTAGESPAGATSTLVDLYSGASITLANTPSVSGNVITQVVEGPTDLVRQSSFLLTVTFQASPSVNIWSMELTIHATA